MLAAAHAATQWLLYCVRCLPNAVDSTAFGHAGVQQLSQLSDIELRRELQRHGLDTSGYRTALIARLTPALAACLQPPAAALTAAVARRLRAGGVPQTAREGCGTAPSPHGRGACPGGPGVVVEELL